MRLEHDKPQQIPIDITISFGASTRTYTLRKRPQAIQAVGSALQDSGEAGESISGLLGLPESETEMDVSDAWTYFNAHHALYVCMYTYMHTYIHSHHTHTHKYTSHVRITSTLYVLTIVGSCRT